MRIPTRERYQNDPIFQQIVDVLYYALCKHEYTPTELREAAMMAAIKFETLHVRPLFFNKETGEITYGAKSQVKECLDL